MYNKESLLSLTDSLDFSDSTGVTLYYNLKGKRFTEKNGKSDYYIVFTKEDDIQETIRKGYYLLNPGIALLDHITTAYHLSDSLGLEHFFVVGKRSKMSDIERGIIDAIFPNVIQQAKTTLVSRGDELDFSVHSHPLIRSTISGEVEAIGGPLPSGPDLMPQYPMGGRFEMVLGHEVIDPVEYRQLDKGVAFSTSMNQPQRYRQVIGLYNQGEVIGTIFFDKLIELVCRYNKVKRYPIIDKTNASII
ncbi:hypothetical protein [Chitinophaga sp. sic0106]|uniref:hypothetical protein n=1 Tax=Chitinophaga sp. sic0106 TaxID=2854785 RepID=UPI001C445F04|nr:hypothetical protein [Chitinophaga sp. sic0106]MBV7529605.1 hypothetical protein [Chitinophaga sp. sic0106]